MRKIRFEHGLVAPPLSVCRKTEVDTLCYHPTPFACASVDCLHRSRAVSRLHYIIGPRHFGKIYTIQIGVLSLCQQDLVSLFFCLETPSPELWMLRLHKLVLR